MLGDLRLMRHRTVDIADFQRKVDQLVAVDQRNETPVFLRLQSVLDGERLVDGRFFKGHVTVSVAASVP